MTREVVPPANQPSEERFACEVLRRAVGAHFTEYDDNSRPGQVDGLFDLPDGRAGAIEVTTLGDPGALEAESHMFRDSWHVEGSTWLWMINAGHSVRFDEFRRHLAALVRRFESDRNERPSPRHYQGQGDAFDWWCGADVRFHGFPATKEARIDVLPKGDAGAVHEDLDGLPGWLEDRLAEPQLGRKLAKLASTGRPELHLFLRIHESGMPFRLLEPLGWTGVLPAVQLVPPDGLTGLWLAPPWNNPILRWSADGWRRENVLD